MYWNVIEGPVYRVPGLPGPVLHDESGGAGNVRGRVFGGRGRLPQQDAQGRIPRWLKSRVVNSNPVKIIWNPGLHLEEQPGSDLIKCIPNFFFKIQISIKLIYFYLTFRTLVNKCISKEKFDSTRIFKGFWIWIFWSDPTFSKYRSDLFPKTDSDPQPWSYI